MKNSMKKLRKIAVKEQLKRIKYAIKMAAMQGKTRICASEEPEMIFKENIKKLVDSGLDVITVMIDEHAMYVEIRWLNKKGGRYICYHDDENDDGSIDETDETDDIFDEIDNIDDIFNELDETNELNEKCKNCDSKNCFCGIE